jgi:hypothetical protein
MDKVISVMMVRRERLKTILKRELNGAISTVFGELLI